MPDSYFEKLCAEAQRVRGASPGQFRVVNCSRFNGEATILGESATLEAAKEAARAAAKPLEPVYVYDDTGALVFAAEVS